MKKISTLFLLAIILLCSLYTTAQINRRNTKKTVPYRANYQRLSVGCSADHGFEIREGTLWGWGNNDSSQLGDGTNINRKTAIQIGTDDKWVSISVGLTHTLGLKADGTLWAWGYNAYGELGDGTKQTFRRTPIQIGNDSSWISITTGQHFSLGLKADGRLWTWGINNYGQLGDGTDTNRLSPTLIVADSNWVAISAGSFFSHAIKADGTLWGWGNNVYGSVGDGTDTTRKKPVQIGNDNSWVTLSSGGGQTLAIKADGTLWSWGINTYGEVGNGNTNHIYSPVQIGSDNNWVYIYAGFYHSLALKSCGTLWAWGNNSWGAVGDSTSTDRHSPVQIGSDSNWVSVAGGNFHSFGLKANGIIWSWGYNNYGQLYDSTDTVRIIPTLTKSYILSEWISISAGGTFTLGLKSDGTLWAWGCNNGGTLGDSTSINRDRPVQIGKANNWTSISASTICGFALKSNGSLWAWGRGAALGDSNINNISYPIQIGVDKDYVSVASTETHSHALKSDGTLWGWGQNDAYQLGDSSNARKLIPTKIGTANNWVSISVGGNSYQGMGHGHGLKADGTLWGWGSNGYGELGDSTTGGRKYPIQIGTNNDWISIVGTDAHTICLKASGTLWAWGRNNGGQLGDSTTKDRTSPLQVGKESYWLSIATSAAFASSSHGLKTDGTLWSWGANDDGQLGDGSTTARLKPVHIGTDKNWVSVKGGSNHTMGLKSSRSLFCGVGSNDQGELGDGTKVSRTSYMCNTNCLAPSIPTDSTPKSSLTICANNKTKLHVVGKGLIIWYSDSSCNTFLDTGNYYNTKTLNQTTTFYALDSICIRSVSPRAITVIVNPLPSANVGSNKIICIRDSAYIGSSAVNGNTYSWTSNPLGYTSNLANPVVAPNVNTTYYLTETITSTGCAKLDSVKISVNSNFTTITKTSCNSYTFSGNTISSSGVYYDTLKNYLGCDSIITLNLTIIQSSYNTLTKTACDKYSFSGNSLAASGVYYDTLTNAKGCDSIITLNLTINNSSGSTIFDTACGSYSFKGNTITTSGIYYDTVSNTLGCDSIITLRLTIQPTNFNLSFTQNTQVFTTPPFDVQFLNTTPSKNSYTFTWVFGDGTYYVGTNPPKHTYQTNGYYDITLIAQNNTTGCTDTLYKQGWIYCSGGVTCTHTAQIIQTNITNKCSGDSIYLFCISAPTYSYQWLLGGIKIQGATDSFIYAYTSGKYSVIVTDSNCPLTSNIANVDFYKPTPKPIIYHKGSLVFCTGGSVELYVNSSYSTYNWNNGATSYQTYINNSGNFFVQVVDSNGCKALSDTFSLNASFISPPPICLVSVDSSTNKNIVIWEKANAGSIDSFVILKETSQANIYNTIGKVPYAAFSTFVDTASNPDVQANRYKLQAIDTCGITTLASDYHKTIHLTINKGQGNNWNLIWSHYEGIQFASYNIYRGTSSAGLSLLTTIASNLNSYTDVNPPTGNLYYQIEVVNLQGCAPSQKTYSYSSTKSNIANINQIGIENVYHTKYSVFPNPTNGQINIQASKKLINATIKLYNITGQLIIQKSNLSGDNFNMDLSGYARGIYILEINEGERVERIKVVKE
ncbi:MAG: T9SS type A sorting domain-containing protein [Bacteroidota bacterium]|nr:T9SS type A sorting domain-containing protein [Bacteroidota bacterium]